MVAYTYNIYSIILYVPILLLLLGCQSVVLLNPNPSLWPAFGENQRLRFDLNEGGPWRRERLDLPLVLGKRSCAGSRK